MLAPEGDVHCTAGSESPWRNRMYYYGKELCFLLALLFTSYAALQSSPPKVSKVPPPVRFFRQNSVVEDFYSGNMNDALDKVADSEMTFVMYYAPWDAESQKVRWHFEAAARYYHTQIYFAAINCWQPGSECRRQFAKIPLFPVLMLYPMHHTGVHYRGVREVSHMIQFLRTSLSPLVRITSTDDLKALMARHDGVVVGFLNFQGKENTSKLYDLFYDTSLNFLERDQSQEVVFAIVTGEETAARFKVRKMPSIRLFMWNESVAINHPVSNWTSEVICDWVSRNLHQVSFWVQPPGLKSLTFSSHLTHGPAIVLFTPRNPLLSQIYYYDLMREVALDFFNCDNSIHVAKLNRLVSIVRTGTPLQYQEDIKACAAWRKSRGQCPGVLPVLSIQHDEQEPNSGWRNISSPCGRQQKETLYPPRNSFDHGYCGLLNYDSDVIKLISDEDSEENSDGWLKYLSFKKQPTSKRVDVKRSKKIKDEMYNGLTTMLVGSGDHLWAENLGALAKDEHCRVLRHARLLDRPYYPNPTEILNEGIPQNITGMGCSANKTLSFLALDSLQLHQFAEGLGVDVLHREDRTALFLLNPEEESQYLLEGPLNKESFVNFVKGYILNTLPRWLRSTSLKPRDTGFSFGPTQTIHVSRYSERVISNCPENAVCVSELSSSSFKLEVLDSKKNVVVMYYSPYCAFCNGVSHVFLTVAHTLQSVNTLAFARIDGDNNDLPWEFTMHRFPSILFVPGLRKSESHIFPATMQITVQNLVQFILSNLTPEERVWTLLVICKHGSTRHPLSFQDQLSVDKCVTQVKIEVQQAAGQLLSKYRSLIINWSEDPGRQGSLQVRRSLKRRLTARLRFFRHATSTLMALSDKNVLAISDALSQVREAFFQLQEALTDDDLKQSPVLDEQMKLYVDYYDVSENLNDLSSSIQRVLNSTTQPEKNGKVRDEL